MAKYITEFYDIKQNSVGRPSENKKLATKLQGCANYLVFKRYLTVDEVRLHAANFCKKHLLCPFCAMRRGRSIFKFTTTAGRGFTGKPQFKGFHGYFDCERRRKPFERFTHLRKSLKKYQQQRRDALKGQKQVEYAKALGGVMSIEVKRGKIRAYGIRMFT